jgi:dTDP-4-amino-4,6-dideoxygalactose transaminase
MAIAMRPSDAAHFSRRSARFPSARAAFEAYLTAKGIGPGARIALPAYIGWSAREGSGVFDPVRAVGAEPVFYRMTQRLEVDLDDLRRVLRDARPQLLVVIHFFGWPDAGLREVARVAADAGIPLLEDEAHAMLSDVVGGVCGRDGEAAIYSSHKMLPTHEGGELVAGPDADDELFSRAFAAGTPTIPAVNRWDYDLHAISAVRRHNAQTLLHLLEGVDGLTPLHPSIPDGVVPQTLPVVIASASRDELYHRMNAAGYGVTSLYHTMIDQLDPSRYPDAHWLSRRILNLPVHQDANPTQLPPMVELLATLLRG